MSNERAGRYCAKHQEFAPTGECRWCEPAEPAPVTAASREEVDGTWSPLPADILAINAMYQQNHRTDWRNESGAISAVTQANGLTLPALPALKHDPTMRADLEAAWDSLYGKVKTQETPPPPDVPLSIWRRIPNAGRQWWGVPVTPPVAPSPREAVEEMLGEKAAEKPDPWLVSERQG